jgi:hypothetical protein
MDMHESDLKDFASDLGLARLTDSTIATYVRHCERWAEQAEGTFTIRSAKSWLSTLTPWAAYMGGRSIRRYVKSYSGEYKVEGWSAEVPQGIAVFIPHRHGVRAQRMGSQVQILAPPPTRRPGTIEVPGLCRVAWRTRTPPDPGV